MRIAIVSGSRADDGPLRMVFAQLTNFRPHDVEWRSLNTYQVHSTIDAADEAAIAVGETVGAFRNNTPDLAILLGDRYEILGVAVAFNVMGIPIAHLSGGDITEGSQDDCYRHAITKLSHLHFATCEESAARIIQMGEEPERVHVVGCPGVDRILQTKLMAKDEVFNAVGLVLPHDANFVLGCLHPNTLGNTENELRDFLNYLRTLHACTGIVLIGPNQDAGNDIIRDALKAFSSGRPYSAYHDAVEGCIYLSLIKHCSVFVGNSSALYYEAPTFGAYIREIGDRQKGRKFHKGDGRAAERIAAIISKIENPKALLRKRFRDQRNP